MVKELWEKFHFWHVSEYFKISRFYQAQIPSNSKNRLRLITRSYAKRKPNFYTVSRLKHSFHLHSELFSASTWIFNNQTTAVCVRRNLVEWNTSQGLSLRRLADTFLRYRRCLARCHFFLLGWEPHCNWRFSIAGRMVIEDGELNLHSLWDIIAGGRRERWKRSWEPRAADLERSSRPADCGIPASMQTLRPRSRSIGSTTKCRWCRCSGPARTGSSASLVWTSARETARGSRSWTLTFTRGTPAPTAEFLTCRPTLRHNRAKECTKSRQNTPRTLEHPSTTSIAMSWFH